MNCDLCSTNIGDADPYFEVRPEHFRDAATAGLRPRGENASMMKAGAVLGIRSMDEQWLARVLQDSTNWILCAQCEREYRRHGGVSAPGSREGRPGKRIQGNESPIDPLDNDEDVQRVRREQASFYKSVGVLRPLVTVGGIPGTFAVGIWIGLAMLNSALLAALLSVSLLIAWFFAIRRVMYVILQRRGRAILRALRAGYDAADTGEQLRTTGHGQGGLMIGVMIGVLVITAGVVVKSRSDGAAAEAQARTWKRQVLAFEEERGKYLRQLAANREADREAVRRQIDDANSRGREPSNPKKTDVATLPALSQDDIVRAMNALQPSVNKCYNRYEVPGTANVSISVSKGGRVASATVTGGFAGTPSGACVEAATKTAKFPPCEAMSFPWPFQLR
jgi:hypothetical protein